MRLSTPTEMILDERDAVIAVGMNGEPLPIVHGFPPGSSSPGWTATSRPRRGSSNSMSPVSRPSTLVGAVKGLGLVETLNSAKEITAFAPTNDVLRRYGRRRSTRS
jgi:hypothetical protein